MYIKYKTKNPGLKSGVNKLHVYSVTGVSGSNNPPGLSWVIR